MPTKAQAVIGAVRQGRRRSRDARPTACASRANFAKLPSASSRPNPSRRSRNCAPGARRSDASGEHRTNGDKLLVDATLTRTVTTARPRTTTVDRIRSAVKQVIDGADALVGGSSADEPGHPERIAARPGSDHPAGAAGDPHRARPGAARADSRRSCSSLTVVLSFAASLGVSAVVFNHLFHFANADPAFPLFVFVFLVALGHRLQHLLDDAGA